MLREYLNNIHFEWPGMLWLLCFLVPILIWLLLIKSFTGAQYKVNALPPVPIPRSAKIYFRKLPNILQIIAISLLIVSMARPVTYETVETNTGNGVDIVLCLDVSGSMLAQDFQPNRLQASLAVAREFVTRRKGDRIGIVIFSGQSFTLCPVTSDHAAVLSQLQKVNYGLLNDGTSIGSGLASSVERLRSSGAASRLVVLLTDGEDTGGKMDPYTAKEIAKTFGIKVYTIGMGTVGYAKMPYKTVMGNTVMEEEKVSIDEKLLTEIATETGGRYFRATNRNELEQIYTDIDQLEKSEVETVIFKKRHERFLPWAMAAIILLMISWILNHTWLRKFP